MPFNTPRGVVSFFLPLFKLCFLQRDFRCCRVGILSREQSGSLVSASAGIILPLLPLCIRFLHEISFVENLQWFLKKK